MVAKQRSSLAHEHKMCGHTVGMHMVRNKRLYVENSRSGQKHHKPKYSTLNSSIITDEIHCNQFVHDTHAQQALQWAY